MKLQFKHQPFQAEAAAAVCDVFRGQSLCAQAHRQGLGAAADRPLSLAGTGTGLCNQPLAPELTDARSSGAPDCLCPRPWPGRGSTCPWRWRPAPARPIPM